MVFNEFIIYTERYQYETHLIRLELKTGKIVKKQEFSECPRSVDKIDEVRFVFGTSIEEIMIWNTDLVLLFKKKCHPTTIKKITSYKNGLIVSECESQEVKIWNLENLKLMNQIILDDKTIRSKDEIIEKMINSNKN